MSDTREKIFDSAERLFGERGYAGTSLRRIIADAGVNLAAIHYHLGSKEELLDALIVRRAVLMNEARVAMLDRFEADAFPNLPSLEKILESFLMPLADMASENPQFVRLMGRMHSEGLLPKIIERHFHPSVARFAGALQRALPQIEEDDLQWRLHFMMGALANALCGVPVLPFPSFAAESLRDRMRRLVAFLSAGFRVPVTNTTGL